MTEQQFQSALQACRSDLPNNGQFGGGFGNSAQAAAYRNCLALHGVNLPPGRPSGGNSAPSTTSTTVAGGTTTTTVAPNSPAYQAALNACASLRPTRPGGSTTTTTATSATS